MLSVKNALFVREQVLNPPLEPLSDACKIHRASNLCFSFILIASCLETREKIGRI